MSTPDRPVLGLAGLTELADKVIWMHGQTRDEHPDMHRLDRVAQTAKGLLGNFDVDSLALLAAELIDRASDARPGAPGTWRCNTTERCFREDGHGGHHGFAGTPAGDHHARLATEHSTEV